VTNIIDPPQANHQYSIFNLQFRLCRVGYVPVNPISLTHNNLGCNFFYRGAGAGPSDAFALAAKNILIGSPSAKARTPLLPEDDQKRLFIL
jgi:hypothetical protein